MVSAKWFSSFYLSEFEINQCLVLWDGVMAVIGAEGEELKGITISNLLMAIALGIVHLSRK